MINTSTRKFQFHKIDKLTFKKKIIGEEEIINNGNINKILINNNGFSYIKMDNHDYCISSPNVKASPVTIEANEDFSPF
jgi:hypothetical protein